VTVNVVISLPVNVGPVAIADSGKKMTDFIPPLPLVHVRSLKPEVIKQDIKIDFKV
jgi:hypothetical protein